VTRPRIVLGVVAAVIVVAIPLVASSCARAREAAETASQEFRTRIKAGAYKEVVQSATPEFQESTTETDFASAMETIKTRLGVWESSDEPIARVFAGTNGQTVTLVYASRFERGTATEEFVWRIRQGRSALAGYHVKSSIIAAH
jgi:predicted membrane-bound mannosyltransferase